jgi:hypothetical protein
MAPSSSTQHSSPPHESTPLPKRSLRHRASNAGLATGPSAPSDGVATASDRDGDLRGDAEDGHAHNTRGGNFPAQKIETLNSLLRSAAGGGAKSGTRSLEGVVAGLDLEMDADGLVNGVDLRKRKRSPSSSDAQREKRGAGAKGKETLEQIQFKQLVKELAVILNSYVHGM